MAWILLIIAGVLEVVWAYAMKLSNGFTQTTPTLVTAMAMVGSVVLLAIAMRTIPLGTAYVIWTGIGAIGTFLVGIIWLGEALTPLRLTAAVLIISGLLLLKWAEN
mgnify:CR=1 FL=1